MSNFLPYIFMGITYCMSGYSIENRAVSTSDLSAVVMDSSEKSTVLPPSLEELNHQFYSQASQDQFVHLLLYTVLGKQDCGYYLEIGAADPVDINNTYLFEKDYGWNGISIEIDSSYKQKWFSTRKNPLLIADATRVNYKKILSKFPEIIDYLSLDIDEQYDTVLKKIPFQNHIFKIITIEHDHWRYGDTYRQKEREILTSLGYYLLCSDVWLHSKASFEDWWIYPDVFPKHILTKLTSLDLRTKKHSELLSLLNTELRNEIYIQKSIEYQTE